MHNTDLQHLSKLSRDVNPYLGKFMDAMESEAFPVFYNKTLLAQKGKWQAFFNEKMGIYPEHIWLDIGCYKGRTVLEMAQDHPNAAFIGMDITFKRVMMSAERGSKLGLTNVAWCLANAKELNQYFESELDGVSIFFPDPWMKKKKQKKHQLFSESFCNQVEQVLRPMGYLWLKTDQESYFENASQFLASQFLKTDLSQPKWLRNPYFTVFEELFLGQGQSSRSGVWLTTKNNKNFREFRK